MFKACLTKFERAACGSGAIFCARVRSFPWSKTAPRPRPSSRPDGLMPSWSWSLKLSRSTRLSTSLHFIVLFLETSHDFFSLRFSLQFWYRWKEGSNSGITSKFEVDPSKRSRVRAERSRKVERKSGRTLEICSVAQSRFRPPPGAHTCMHVLHARSPFPTVALRSSIQLPFFSSSFFSTSFLWLHQVEIYTTISSALHWFFALYTINLPWP